MAVCFSVNHGTVTALVALAAANLGDELGGTQSGVLYITYVFTALFGSAAFVSILGTKWALMFSTALYCSYVICFVICAIFPSIKWPAALVGAFLGGIAAGNLWTAQGAYFGEVVQAYSQASGIESSQVSSTLSGYFAFCYLSFEVLCKLLSSLLYYYNTSKASANTFLYIVFAILAVSSAIGMAFIKSFGKKTGSTNNPQKKCTTEKAFGAISLALTDRKMLYMWAPSASFGILSSFLNFYVNGTIVKDSVGKSNIGFFGATVGGVAAISSIVFSWLAKKYGKGPFLILGQICFLCEAVFCLIFTNDQLGDWFPLFCIYTLHGLGRSTFEATMRATFADIWDDSDIQPYAFANIIISNGGASALCFFIFPHIPGNAEATVGVIGASLGIAGYLMARREMSGFHELQSVSAQDIE